MPSSGSIKEIGESCTFVNEHCEFLIHGRHAYAEFSEKVEPETSITLVLDLPVGTKIESAWIEGVNMYMGKVPVLLENKHNGEWSGWFMLGSCNEEKNEMAIAVKYRRSGSTKLPELRNDNVVLITFETASS